MNATATMICRSARMARNRTTSAKVASPRGAASMAGRASPSVLPIRSIVAARADAQFFADQLHAPGRAFAARPVSARGSGVARTVARSAMTVGVSFHLATVADEADIRRLLRENPIGGRYAISVEREPNGLAGTALPDERKTIILARDSAGTAVGLCERIVRPAFVDGERCLLPYLGTLRVAASHRNGIRRFKGRISRRF